MSTTVGRCEDGTCDHELYYPPDFRVCTDPANSDYTVAACGCVLALDELDSPTAIAEHMEFAHDDNAEPESGYRAVMMNGDRLAWFVVE